MRYRKLAQRLFPARSQRDGGWRPVTPAQGSVQMALRPPSASPIHTCPRRHELPHLSGTESGSGRARGCPHTPPLRLDVTCAEGVRAPGSVAQWIAHWTSRQTETFKGCGFESHQSRFSFDKRGKSSEGDKHITYRVQRPSPTLGRVPSHFAVMASGLSPLGVLLPESSTIALMWLQSICHSTCGS
uniref:Uncharacterized protein n=1 Tax=Rangifer tarandus platyrhynchus TaxID=3082113 RepID=A0ACB0DWQ2_RANTA|nr:unnamed protein product [Rangifer tarandus platyrhynchus]